MTRSSLPLFSSILELTFAHSSRSQFHTSSRIHTIAKITFPSTDRFYASPAPSAAAMFCTMDRVSFAIFSTGFSYFSSICDRMAVCRVSAAAMYFYSSARHSGPTRFISANCFTS